jgi:GNAT superfamily N-acetyltransferase
MQLTEPLRVGGVEIETIDLPSVPDDKIALLNTFNNVLLAETDPEFPPAPLALTESQVRYLLDFVARRDFWARDPDGGIAAAATALWTLADDNQHLVRAQINVRPDRRRRGIGTALLGLIADVTEELGRRLLMATTNERVAAGDAFARRVGADAAIATHINRLLLKEVDQSLVERWIDEGPARAPGYSVISVDGVYPDDLVEAIVEVDAVMNTAPRGGLDLEDEEWTVSQLRERERTLFASGNERWSLFARHDSTGELVGFTEVVWSELRPQTVWQWGTAVKPPHRGHALGKWLKAVMLRRILEERPGAIEIRTGNADSNEPMLGINNKLGFKPYQAEMGWQISLEKVRAYLAASSD